MPRAFKSLLFKLAIIFTIFSLVSITMASINVYYLRTNDYKEQCEKNIKYISTYLDNLLRSKGNEFCNMQKYLLKNFKEMKIPIDFDGNYAKDKEIFERKFADMYPGKIFDKDISFNDMPKELQHAYATYVFEKWFTIFEKARDSFNISYAYYITPTGEHDHMYWMIDALREESRYHGKKYLKICEDVLDPYDQHKRMWDAWYTKKSPTGYDVYDNEYGRTYAYYVPFIFEGEIWGLIGVEIEIDTVNSEILHYSIIQILYMSLILFICIAITLFFIYKFHIVKIKKLEKVVKAYTENKDPNIASVIEKNIKNNDELSSLATQIASMIHELSNYMEKLQETSTALSAERERADEMNELAKKDALTGIRNKTAYDSEIKRLTCSIENGTANFAIAIIDLNFLKQINDTYGHEKGNIAIKNLCNLTCKIFKHSPVFRIGGDEFAVILENDDLKNVKTHLANFNKILLSFSQKSHLKPWEKVSAAIGVAYFDTIQDKDVDTVFERADREMYANKKEMKAKIQAASM